jgi:uncharacterized HAD superfamily protein
MKALLNYDIDGLITDNPDILKQLINRTYRTKFELATNNHHPF